MEAFDLVSLAEIGCAIPRMRECCAAERSAVR